MNTEDLNQVTKGFSPTVPGERVSDHAEKAVKDGLLPWLTRRDFLQWTGALTALLAAEGCVREPLHEVLPYTKQPEDVVPDRPLFYATTMAMAGSATGLLVESHMGRPTKIEGNPSHPSSLGATDVWAQAAILGLYDPDRSQVPRLRGNINSWSTYAGRVGEMLAAQGGKKGVGVRVLTESIVSPTLLGQLKAFKAKYPEAKVVQYEPAGKAMAREGARLAFGTPVEPSYKFEAADVVLSLDNDFLFCGNGSIPYTRAFMERRRGAEGTKMNRLYNIENAPTNTGACADHNLPARPSEMVNLAAAIAGAVGVGGAKEAAALSGDQAKWVAGVAKDLKAAAGRSIVLAGDAQPAQVHALAHAMNAALGNVGRTVDYREPLEADPGDELAGFAQLVKDMAAGSVEMLFILGGNPVYSAPADLDFAGALSKVPFSSHLSLYTDETSSLTTWHIAEAHFLEAWGDTRGHDGTIALQQPLIAPLYQGKSQAEYLGALIGQGAKPGYEIVQEYWKSFAKWGEFDKTWRRALHDGVVTNSVSPTKKVSVRPASGWFKASAPQTDLEIAFRPDPSVWDGRFTNNPWLQELPKPLSKLRWDNGVLIGPVTAQQQKLASGDGVELTVRGRTLKAAVFVLPGQPEGVLSLTLGYGRTKAGRVGSGLGFNANAIRSTEGFWADGGVTMKRSGGEFRFAHIRDYISQEGRPLARIINYEEYEKDAHKIHEELHEEDPPPYMTADVPSDRMEYAWGMSINVGTCVGCNACVVACQAENNIPTVGKDEIVDRNRDMHWLRIDRYYSGNPSKPEAVFQPVPCMHCETAPCEYVCPVEATAHSEDGINQMVYNRCVGTRYCSNNCPYKVRRYNFFEYADHKTPVLKLARNPDVTVRSRGVMEKCTYCVQRINEARIVSELEDRSIRDGEIKTACQQACPTGAITFGNIKDPKSRVAKEKAGPLDYSMLAELNTRPRTTYTAKLKNPNPEI